MVLDSVASDNVLFSENHAFYMKLKRGKLVSPCQSVHPMVCPSLDRIMSALYFHNTSQIHFIFTHHINQLQKVCRVLSHVKNYKI